ncbi:trypsin-like serine protease [Alteromonas antoniana]|uniref:trypsin-like serine protease n=1 Tax=Alteromonas antoniana TaxID=2803813 RepID=UPI001C487E85|nr:trypsin-like serine protease [Alteromonas antoniana]
MRFFILLALACCCIESKAVVMRHDISVERYHVEKMPDYIIDLPHEGHGALIAKQWIVTVAHTIFYDYTGAILNIGSQEYQVEKVYIHPNYLKPRKEILSGDMMPLMQVLKSSSDIALIKISKPVSNVIPISLYSKSDEKGKILTVFGKGATGNGLIGENLDTKALHQPNRFQNVVESANGKWLSFKFDSPHNALPLEGMQGSGDSGGASIIYQNGIPYLAGLSSWQFATGDMSTFKGGLYGTTAYQTRISNYYNWIKGVVGS